MADRAVGELPRAEDLYDDALLVAEQQGQAQAVAGALLKDYAGRALDAYVRGAGFLLTVGKTATGPAGSEARVTNAGTAERPVLDFTIPRGPAGGVDSVNGQTGDVVLDHLGPFDLFDVPEMHRVLFRGKSLGSAFTDKQKAAVAAGTFEDLYLGDYWTIGGTTWRIVDMDYWYAVGDTACTAHHLVVMPDRLLYNAPMEETDTTAPGYAGSAIRKTGLDQARTAIQAAFGADYILSHREHLCSKVTDGVPTASTWYDSDLELPSETQMYGVRICAVGSMGGTDPQRVNTIDQKQFALMQTVPRYINPHRQWLHLRDEASDKDYAMVDSGGCAVHRVASLSAGIRPVFGLRGAPAVADEASAPPEIFDGDETGDTYYNIANSGEERI